MYEYKVLYSVHMTWYWQRKYLEKTLVTGMSGNEIPAYIRTHVYTYVHMSIYHTPIYAHMELAAKISREDM